MNRESMSLGREINRDREKMQYPILDTLKLVFALLIPLLHIRYTGGVMYTVAQQYIARLGVPFFFAATGFLLERDLKKSLS